MKNGLLEIQTNRRRECQSWTLTVKGFEFIKDLLPPLKEVGFKSENIDHDFLSTAAHLGDWLSIIPKGADFFSEQELRRYSPEQYPDWVPKTLDHRPDGYWKITFDETVGTIALELELSEKSKGAYRVAGDFYNTNKMISRVIWIVQGMKMAERILSFMAETSAHAKKIHNFILVDQFKVSGWQTRIVLGPEINKTLDFVLHGQPQSSGMSTTCPQHVRRHFDDMLDTRLKPFNFVT